jgi:hypothetical protein
VWAIEGHHVEPVIGHAKFYSRSHDAVIRVYDEAGNVIETHEHGGEKNAITSLQLVNPPPRGTG